MAKFTDKDIHDLLNAIGIAKNYSELILLGKSGSHIEAGRKEMLKKIITRLDAVISIVKSKK